MPGLKCQRPNSCLPTATLAKNLSAPFYPSSGSSGLPHQLPVSHPLQSRAAGHGCDALSRDQDSPKHPQLAPGSALSRGVSSTAGSFCAGKAREEKVNISVPWGLLSDGRACFHPGTDSVPTLQGKEVRSQGCKHEHIAKTLTESPLPNIYISCVFWLPAEKYLLCVNYTSLGAFYLQRKICSTHEFAIFQLKLISRPKLPGCQ